MSLYKRADSPYWWIKLPAIKGEIRPLYCSTGTNNKRQAQRMHDKLKTERWEQDQLGVKPSRTWDDAAAKWLEDTAHKRTHEWDKSMLRWLTPYLVGKELSEINRELLDRIKSHRANGVTTATANRYMALVRAILRRACYEWEWMTECRRSACLSRARGGFGHLLALNLWL